MTTIAPPRAEVAQATGKHRPRWWPLILAAILGLLAAGVLGWQAVGRSYQPLYSALFGTHGAPRDGRFLVYKDGGLFRVRFDINNGGRWPIEIRDVSFAPPEDLPMRQRSVEMSRRIDPCCGRPVPFRPFVLGPGEYRIMVARFEFVGCRVGGPGSQYGLGDPTVELRFLGIDRRIQLNLQGRTWVTGPPIGCHR
jgi:hypothetical protein